MIVDLWFDARQGKIFFVQNVQIESVREADRSPPNGTNIQNVWSYA
jgi:hypothetical protein